MIPSCLNLTEGQIARVRKWRDTLPKLEESEDCTMMSDITFEVISTGLGDIINATCFGNKLSLTIDDDGGYCD